MTTANSKTDGTRRGRVQFIALAVLFMGPLIIAWILYFGGGWRPTGTTNHGILVDPPVPLPEVRIADAGPAQVAIRPVGRWTMLYADGGECAERCLQALDMSARVRVALGRRIVRVQRAYIAEGDGLDGPLPEAQADLMVASTSRPEIAEMLAQLPADLPRDGTEILLIDPLGNLMMRFPLSDDPKGMLEDIKKLLKLSRIG